MIKCINDASQVWRLLEIMILITFYQVYVKGCYINLKTDCNTNT